MTPPLTNQQLIAKVKYHAWASDEPRDMYERIEIMRALCGIPLKESLEIFKMIRSDGERAAAIALLTSFIKNRREREN